MPKKATSAPPATDEAKAKDDPAGEHIFPATRLTNAALRWKALTNQGRHAEAMPILEEIIVGSTMMFERLAQHEDFHHTVDLKILVAAAHEKVVKWLIRWRPKKGRLFSWFSKCAKNAFMSEVVKMSQYRKRHQEPGEDFEKYFGTEDHEADKVSAADRVSSALDDIYCRWGDPQEIGCIHFLIECIIEDDHDKQASIRGATYAYGVSPELSKFFYNWALVALRDAMYDQVRMPFTKQELLIYGESYSLLVDIINILPWDQAQKLIALLGGQRVKFPTVANLAKLRDDYRLWLEIESSDKTPDDVAVIAKRYKRTARTAQETYERVSEIVQAHRAGEYKVYPEKSEKKHEHRVN